MQTRRGIFFGFWLLAGCSGIARLPATHEVMVQSQHASAPLRETVLHFFSGPPDGTLPNVGRLVFDRFGNLYGATNTGGSGTCAFRGHVTGCGVVFELVRSPGGGWSERVLYSFKRPSDGAGPYSTLTLDASGDIYGVTMGGGNQGCVPLFWVYHGCGTIYELRNAAGVWTKRVLHVFSGGTDGGNPVTNLVTDSKGNLYGTAYCGGGQYSCYSEGSGSGVFFELTRGSDGVWNETVLHVFGRLGDGGNPNGDLTPMGLKILGTTGGTVYEMTHSPARWSEKVLFIFPYNFSGGYVARGGLVFDDRGNLYGTTLEGGHFACDNGCGVVFELTQSGGSWNETVLHKFTGGADGASPWSGLAIDSSGALFGTTPNGGDLHCNNGGGCGVAFKLVPNGKGSRESVLHTFEDDAQDGGGPVSAVTLGTRFIYGTTSVGGPGPNLGKGTAFSLSR